MRARSAVVSAVLAVLAASQALAAGTKPAAEVLPRVEHHLRAIDDLSRHFETVLRQPCPHFAVPTEWKTYFDGEIDRVVTLVAHVEQAWREALQTGDDDVRRAAKAPRKRMDEARNLIDKLQSCAENNGAVFSQMAVWRRIERQVPQRQQEITQPQ